MRFFGSVSILVSLALVLAACGDDDSPDTERDSGPGNMDAGTVDAGTRDAAPGDMGTVDAGPGDSGPSDSGPGPVDAGPGDTGPMSCVDCAPPPPGCRLEGGSCTSCGTLVCEDAGVDAGTPPVACGGRAGDPCGESEYCRYDAPSSCSRDDSQGECTAIPDSCPPGGAPVCGCDGMPYSSECAAAMARMGILTDGTTCEGSGTDCRTTGCPGSEHCDLCRTTMGPAYVCLPEGAVC